MWIFSIFCVISAVVAIQQGHIANTVGASDRAAGLADQPNASARYFVVAMVFFSYLATVGTKPFLRLLAIGGEVVTFLGVFFTLSRTGILLLFAAIGLQIIINTRRKFNYLVFFAYSIAALTMWFLSDKIINIIKSILPSILQGTDTIGLRYELWQAGLRMWLDHIFQGVGIGMFPAQLRYYAPGLPERYWTLGGHDTYINVLAETGLVGFGLFLLMLILALKNYLQSGKIDDIKSIALRNVWLIVFLITLLGGITLNGQNDKLLWFLIGVSVYFQNQFSLRTQKNAVDKPASNIQLSTFENR
jgi:O-antigen ligase